MATLLPTLPDLAALEQVRTRLWEDRAAVFVGSGLSRHAARTGPTAPPFPLWGDLAAEMAAELYPGDEARAPRDALRLAQEMEQTLTRNGLDRLVTRLVPDDRYQPGPNHVALLELPWADVLTTNYDTLLERAARLSGRRYSPVYRAEDLARTAAPRIVKLHGSLPSHTPFVLTEDDFRRYPLTHAPFVSLAQTLLSEHAVLLLGFSGDDPNFLNWSGWVRDHLQASAPPLFLAGLLDLPDPTRTLLKSRGVAPIDLAPIFPEDRWPDAQARHEAAVQWLLAALAAARPPDPVDWPGPFAATPTHISLPGHFPSLPPDPYVYPDRSLESPVAFGKPGTIQEAARGYSDGREPSSILEPWRQERARYPGWVVAPKDVRDRLWHRTERWNRAIIEHAEQVENPDLLFLLAELAWRLDRALLPMFSGERNVVLQTLRRYNPAPHRVTLPADSPSDADGQAGSAPASADASPALVDVPFTPASHPHWPWGQLVEAWGDLALTALRSLREAGIEDEFALWHQAVAPLAADRPAWAARLGYEAALLGLARLDSVAVQGALAAWPDTLNGFPFGEAWRASVLAEWGDWERAARTAEAALGEVLSAQATDVGSLALRSQEGWIRALLQNIGQAARRSGGTYAVRKQPEGWSRSLARLGCNPYALLDPLEAAVLRPLPTLPTEGAVTPSFDPGRYSQSYGRSRYRFDDHRHAFEYLRMREEGAVPLRIGAFSLDGSKVVQAAGWVRPFVPELGYSVLLRNASDEAEHVLSRPRVAGLSDTEVEALFNWLLQGVRAEATELAQGGSRRGAAASKLQGLTGLLSRLVVRMGDSARSDVLDVALRLAPMPGVQDRRTLYRAIGTLVERAAEGAGRAVLRDRIDALVSLPLPGRDLASHGAMGQWFDPTEVLPMVELEPEDVRPDTVATLLTAVREQAALPPNGGTPEQERHVAQALAAARLRYLYAYGGLTAYQTQAFAEALWSGVEDDTLPDVWWPSPTYFLDAPPPPHGASRAERVRKALLDAMAEREPEGVVGLQGAGDLIMGPMRKATVPLSGNAPARSDRIDWLPVDVVAILQWIAAWWTAEHDRYVVERDKEAHGTGGLFPLTDAIDRQVQEVPLTLRDVVLPRLSGADSGGEVLRLLEDMRSAGFAVSAAYPDLLRFGVAPDLVATRIREELTAADPWKIENGAWAVRRWMGLHATGKVVAVPEDIVAEIVSLVSARRRPGLASVLEAVALCLTRTPEAFSPSLISRLVAALDYLRHETAPLDADVALISPEIGEVAEPHLRGERGASAALARALHDWHCAEGLPVPDEVERWRSIAAADPLPEVRDAWPAHDAFCASSEFDIAADEDEPM